MKKLFVLLSLAVVFVMAGGCIQSAPMPPASTPVLTLMVTPAIPGAAWTPVPTAPVITPANTVSVSDNTITIMKNAFIPANLTVTAGSTVRWVNGDDHPHRIEFSNKEFTTSTYLLAAGQSFSMRFDSRGTYDYDCMIHPYMQGSITVE